LKTQTPDFPRESRGFVVFGVQKIAPWDHHGTTMGLARLFGAFFTRKTSAHCSFMNLVERGRFQLIRLAQGEDKSVTIPVL